MTLQTIKQYGEFTCNLSHLNRLCAKVNAEPEKVYPLIREYGGMDDTVTREAIFSYVAEKYHKEYNEIYHRWLDRGL